MSSHLKFLQFQIIDKFVMFQFDTLDCKNHIQILLIVIGVQSLINSHNSKSSIDREKKVQKRFSNSLPP